MDFLNDPRVTPITDGYEVNASDGPLRVFPRETGHGEWAVYFASSTITSRRPYCGVPGSLSASADEAVGWALR